MKNKNLIVCDTEEEYAKALAEFFMQKKEFRFQVHVCSSLEHANSLGRTFQADILVSAAEHVKKMQEKLQAKRVFVLGTGKGAESLGYPVLYKYQSGEALLREIIQKCSDLFEEEEMPRNMAGAGKRKIIGVFSPVHRIGKTEYALSLGEKMAESENVLYLNLEIFSGVGERFGGNAQTLTDVLYCPAGKRECGTDAYDAGLPQGQSGLYTADAGFGRCKRGKRHRVGRAVS